MPSFRSLLLPLCTLLIHSVAAAAATDPTDRNLQTYSLIINGGFEIPFISSSTKYININNFPLIIGGWVIDESSCAQGQDLPNINIVNSAYWDAAEGRQSIDLNGDGNTAPSIVQSVTTVPGMLYNVTWKESMNYESGPANNVMYQFRIPTISFAKKYTVFGDARRNAKNMMYREQYVEFTATQYQTEIIFETCITTSKGPVLDDVKILFSIPPSFLSMSATPRPQPPSVASNSTSDGAIVGAVLGSISVFGLLLLAYYLYNRQKQQVTSSHKQTQQKLQRSQNKKLSLIYVFGGNKSVQEWNNNHVIHMPQQIGSAPSSSANTPAPPQSMGEPQQISALSLVNQNTAV